MSQFCGETWIITTPITEFYINLNNIPILQTSYFNINIIKQKDLKIKRLKNKTKRKGEKKQKKILTPYHYSYLFPNSLAGVRIYRLFFSISQGRIIPKNLKQLLWAPCRKSVSSISQHIWRCILQRITLKAGASTSKPSKFSPIIIFLPKQTILL